MNLYNLYGGTTNILQKTADISLQAVQSSSDSDEISQATNIGQLVAEDLTNEIIQNIVLKDAENKTGVISGHGAIYPDTFIVVPDNITIYPVVVCGMSALHQRIFPTPQSRNRFYDVYERGKIKYFQEGYSRVYEPGSLMPEQEFIFEADFEDSFFLSGIITTSIPQYEQLVNLDDKNKLSNNNPEDVDAHFQVNFTFPFLNKTIPTDEHSEDYKLYKRISTQSNNNKILSNDSFGKRMFLSEVLTLLSHYITQNQDAPKKYILLSCRTASIPTIEGEFCKEDIRNVVKNKYSQDCLTLSPIVNDTQLQSVSSTSEYEFHKYFKHIITAIYTDLKFLEEHLTDEFLKEHITDKFITEILNQQHSTKFQPIKVSNTIYDQLIEKDTEYREHSTNTENFLSIILDGINRIEYSIDELSYIEGIKYKINELSHVIIHFIKKIDKIIENGRVASYTVCFFHHIASNYYIPNKLLYLFYE